MPVAPAPKEKPMFKCELIVTGKIGTAPRPSGGELVVTNTSTEILDIGTKVGPLGLVEIKVKEPNALDFKTTALANRMAPFDGVQPHPLKPGDSFRAQLGLLFALPEEKRIPGTYKVKAVFTFKKKDYESAEVEVKWPENKK